MMKRVRNNKKELNLNWKFTYLALFTFTIIFILCFTVITFIFSRREIRDTKALLTADYHRAEDLLDTFMNEQFMTSYTVVCSKWAQQLLSKTMFSSEADYQLYKANATHFLNSISTINNDMNCVIISKDNKFVKNNNSFKLKNGYSITHEAWYGKLLKDHKYIDYSGGGLFTNNTVKRSISVYYLVNSIYNFKLLGYYAVNLGYNQFDFLREAASVDEYIIIRDEYGNYVLSNFDNTDDITGILNQEMADKVIKKDGYIVYKNTLMNGHWNVWIFKKNRPLFDTFSKYIYAFLILPPVVIILLIISLLFLRYLTEPIVLCTNAMKKIRNNQFGITIPNRYNDQIGQMIDGFNEMSTALSNLIQQNRMKDKLRQEAELKILQQRINPHFLCNTLEIMNGMILSGQEMKAVRFCEMLGKMYRYDMGDEDFVSLKEELSYVKNYLAIIQCRNGKLTVSYEIDDEVMNLSILKFIIHPIVENSIKHGFREKPIDNNLTIVIKKMEYQLYVDIIDNGDGIPEEDFLELQDKIKRIKSGQKVQYSGHIGIMNTCYRLFLQYGNECDFMMETNLHYGTKTEIRIPIRE